MVWFWACSNLLSCAVILTSFCYPVLYCCISCYIRGTYLHMQRLLPPLLLYTSVIAAAAAAVRYRVSDGRNCCWFTESDFIQCHFSLRLISTYLWYVYRLAVLYHLPLRNTSTTSSVPVRTRGAKAGVSSPRRSYTFSVEYTKYQVLNTAHSFRLFFVSRTAALCKIQEAC